MQLNASSQHAAGTSRQRHALVLALLHRFRRLLLLSASIPSIPSIPSLRRLSLLLLLLLGLELPLLLHVLCWRGVPVCHHVLIDKRTAQGYGI